MGKAFVGVASHRGLALLRPESGEAIAEIASSLRQRRDRIAFWTVIKESDARTVQQLCEHGFHNEALEFLDRFATDIGRILPSDSEPSRPN
jgi:hypothetical protein